MADRLNAATNYIVTHCPESLQWDPFEGLGPDIVAGVRRITSHDGPNLILSGSSTLTSTLLEEGLADDVLLLVYPVLLGTGKRFFAEGTSPRAFELVSTKAMPDGIIFTTYTVAGPLKTASFDDATRQCIPQRRHRAGMHDAPKAIERPCGRSSPHGASPPRGSQALLRWRPSSRPHNVHTTQAFRWFTCEGTPDSEQEPHPNDEAVEDRVRDASF